MAYLHDRVFDNGLTVLDTEATHLYICSAEPATYAEAITTYALGSKSGISIGAPGARTPSGRKVTVASISGGTVSANGTATSWALVDSGNSRLLAANDLQAPRTVVSGDTFSLNAFDIGIPGPA